MLIVQYYLHMNYTKSVVSTGDDELAPVFIDKPINYSEMNRKLNI